MARPTRKEVGAESQITKKGGRKRVPIHQSRDVLTLDNQDPNYVYRWVNDVKEGTRIKRFEDAGYEVVSQEEAGQVGDRGVLSTAEPGTTATKVVGVDEKVGRPVTGVLMKIKREWYEEDQKAKEEKIRETERSLFANQGRAGNARQEDYAKDGGVDGYYGDGIKKARTI